MNDITFCFSAPATACTLGSMAATWPATAEFSFSFSSLLFLTEAVASSRAASVAFSALSAGIRDTYPTL